MIHEYFDDDKEFDEYDEGYAVDRGTLNDSLWDDLIFTKPHAPLSISVDPKDRSGTFVLDQKKKEIRSLYQKLNRLIRLDHNDELELCQESIIYFFFHGKHAKWMVEVEDKVAAGLEHDKSTVLRKNEIYNFLETLVACHYYDKSPTVLNDPHQRHNFGPFRTITLKRFEEILRALSTRKPSEKGAEDVWYPPQTALQPFRRCLNAAMEQSACISFCKGMAISLDDEKMRHRSSQSAQELNMQRTHQRGSGKPGSPIP